MSESSVTCWLVERDFWDEDVVTLVYATPDGEGFHQRQLAGDLLRSIEVTAGKEFPESELERTPAADRDRYATEAQRVRDRHDVDDSV